MSHTESASSHSPAPDTGPPRSTEAIRLQAIIKKIREENDNLFTIKQKTVVANRELKQKLLLAENDRNEYKAALAAEKDSTARLSEALTAAEHQLAEMKEYADAFLELVDARYGTDYHHIGDGDGIPPKQADHLRALIKKAKKL